MKAEKRWLFFPVKNGAPVRNVGVWVEGIEQRFFEIELADGEPDWWAPLEIGPWKGQELTVQADGPLPPLTQGDALPGSELLYRESLRGQLHFSARRGWLNDPNGMVYSQGEFHLFFQLNPYGWSWGNMHWGHALSRDLVHWEELPIALYPPSRGDAVFSGSAVVDNANTSDWRTGADDLLVGAYTSTARGECMIYSNDWGRSWTEYAGNPVIRHVGRDPRLLWHDPSHLWVMVVYREDQTRTTKEEIEGFDFHTSPDLKHWTYRSRVTGFYECPDLLELPVEGGADGETKWVLMSANTDHLVGRFDGQTFTPETPRLTAGCGQVFYAAQTFSHDPRGRVVQVGWLKTVTPGMPFNGSMSLPHVLTLRATGDGPRLVRRPVEELRTLRARTVLCGPRLVAPDVADPLEGASGELLEIRADFELGAAREVVFDVHGVRVIYDAVKQELSVHGSRAPAPLHDGRQTLIIYADRMCLEIFAADGQYYPPATTERPATNQRVNLHIRGGAVKFDRLEIYELNSIWPQPAAPDHTVGNGAT